MHCQTWGPAALCTNLQMSLVEAAGCATPQFKRTRVGFLEALLSDVNLMGTQKIARDLGGKTRGVEIIYQPRAVAGQATAYNPVTTSVAYCTTQCFTPLSSVVTITHGQYLGFEASEFNLRKVCFADRDTYTRDTLFGLMDALLVTVNSDILATMAIPAVPGSSGIGSFPGLVASLSLDPIIPGPPLSPDYGAIATALQQFKNASGCNRPLFVGAQELDIFVEMTNKGCCNLNGIDLSQAAADFYFFYDTQVSTAFGGPEDYLMLEPGAVQLVWANRNVGEYESFGESRIKTTITDPFTGVTFDMAIFQPDCSDDWQITLSLEYELWTVPINAYQLTDPLFGVNGSFHFTNP